MPDAHPFLSKNTSARCRVVAIWIDWYAYHLARFRGIQKHPLLADGVWGIELVGGIGVHAGLKFRQDLPLDLPVETLMPNSSWQEASKFALAAKLWRRLSKLDPEVVLVPGYYTSPAIAAALWARFHNRKSVLMTESTEGDHARVWWRETFKSILIRLLFNWAVSGGKAHMRYLERLNFPARRIRHFYDVVDNQYLKETVDPLKLKSGTHMGLPHPYFLYVGRLSSEKNVDGLLGEWIRYREHGGSWPLVLVGAGPQTDSLKAIASTSFFARDIYFAGHKTFHELPPFYAFAGCFVLPSTREPWGLVVNEAMAAGLPVLVSSRCGCAEDLVDSGGNGFTFDPLKKGTLAALLERIESLELTTLIRMSDRSREIIDTYTPEALGAQVASIVTA
jgi:glycosyltransferase involved in cell wall biosynthesis